jgi:PKD repeat protein
MLLGAALLTVACERVPLLAPSGSTITLTALATVLPVNGTTDIIAQVIEPSGTPPHSGTTITFTTNLGKVQPAEAETDIQGRVIVKYVASEGSGTATITAISGGVSASGTNAIKIAVGAAAVGKVTVEANPTTIPAIGGTALITAVTFDSNGNLIGGVPVTFTTDAGAMNPAVATTDGNGKAQATLSTTKAATVTATAGIASSSGSGTGSTTTSAQTATVKVTVNVAPSVTLGSPSPATPSVGQSVTFPLTYAADPNGSPVQSVTVDFGDGSKATAFTGKPASVSHTYSAIGSYSVRVTVVDALGDTSSASVSVSVGALGSISVGSPSPTTPTIGQAVSFPLTYNDTANTIQRITVEWGDGTAASSYSGKPTSVFHTYSIGGTFAVRVTAFDSFGNDSVGGISILVSAKAQPTVSISTTGTPTAGTDLTFTATITPAAGSGTNIASSSVDFGDGSSTSLGAVTGANIAIHHVYTTAGTYTVKLTATDTNGGVATGATTVFVQAATPLAVFLGESKTFSGGNTIESFTATVIGLGNSVAVDYFWTFDPGITQHTTTGQVTRTYITGSGGRTVSVTVTTSTGATASATLSINP